MFVTNLVFFFAFLFTNISTAAVKKIKHVILDLFNLALIVLMYDTAQTTDEQEEANDLYTAQKNRWEYSRQTGVQYQDKNSNQHYKYSENKHYSGKIKQKVRAVDPTKGNDCRIWKRGFEESKREYESASAAGRAIGLSSTTVYKIIRNGTHKTWCGEYFVKVKVVNQSSSSSSSSTSRD